MNRLLFVAAFVLLFIFLFGFRWPLSFGSVIFNDVDSEDDYATAIDYLKEKEVIEGYTDGSFKPDNTINRAEFTKILIEAKFSDEEIAECDVEAYGFVDVPTTEWYASVVCQAKNEGWVEGYEDGTFLPGNQIGFSEAAKIVSIAYDGEESTDEIWYKPYVEDLENKGAIPPSIESFSHQITRGEMAEVIYRTDSGIPNGDSLTYADLSGESTTNEIDYGYGVGMLPLGDDKISTSPAVGSVYSCDTHLDGGGAFADGPWLHTDYWDPSGKVTVNGAVDWPSASFSISIKGSTRTLAGNGLPDHGTGVYPISSSDDAYDYDRNPNAIGEQDVDVDLSYDPELASSASCLDMGVIGYATNGVAIFNALDEGGRDAVAHEIQDACGGHPQQEGLYHYHHYSDCLSDESDEATLIGYALDGFGIYKYPETVQNSDLDSCHGETSVVEWNGASREIYHYVITDEFPYTLGCYRGSPQ